MQRSGSAARNRLLASRFGLDDPSTLRANMKLFTKGLLLIAVPSVVELALLGVVFDTQEQTAQAAQWVDNSKQILYQSSAIVDPLLRQAARVRTAMVDRRCVADRSPYGVGRSRRPAVEARRAGRANAAAGRARAQHAAGDRRVSRARPSRSRRRCTKGAAWLRLPRWRPARCREQIALFRDELAAFGNEAARLDTDRSAALARRRERVSNTR